MGGRFILTDENSVYRNAKKGFLTDENGVYRKVKKAFATIGGVYRPCWASGLEYYGKIGTLSNSASGSNCYAASNDNYAFFATIMQKANVFNKDLTFFKTQDLIGNSNATVPSAARAKDVVIFAGTGSSQYNTGVAASDGDTVTTLTNLMSARRYSSPATLSTHAIFASGQSSGGFPANCDAYDMNLVKKTFNISDGRTYMGIAVVNDVALFAGGMASTSGSGQVNTLDWVNEDLTTGYRNALAKVRDNLGGARVENFAIFAGGKYRSTDYYDTIDIFEVLDDGSVVTIATSQKLPSARSGMHGTPIGDVAFFTGGYNYNASTKFRTDTLIFDSSLTWQYGPALKEGWSHMQITTLGDAVLLGGGDISNGSGGYTQGKAVEAFKYF